MSRLLSLMAAGGAVFGLLGGEVAHAQPDLIIESYVGARPGEADALLDPVIVALVSKAFADPKASSTSVLRAISMPTTLLSEAKLEGAKKFIESAYNQYQLGEFKATLRDVVPGLATLDAGPTTLIRVPIYRELRLKGLIATALAHKRLGDLEASNRAAAEIVRSFTDKPIDTSIYSPEAVELVKAARGRLTAGASATLTIEADAPNARIYLNEIYVGVGRVEKTNLPIGDYRIVLQIGDKLSRLHRVRIGAGEKRVLPLSWGLDQALRTDNSRVVLHFDSDADRAAREGSYALALAREAGATRVAVLGIRRGETGRAVYGTLYAATRKTPDGAWVAAEPTLPSRDALSALGAYLGGDKSGADLITPLRAADVVVTPAEPPSDPGGTSVPGWIAVGVGIAAVGAGIGLVAAHVPDFDDDGNRNANPRATRVPGIITASAGAVAIGVGAFLLLRQSGSDEAPGAALHIMPTATGAVAGIRGRF